MRYTKAFIPTQKENPSDAEATSHKLMVRAGIVRKLIAGAYSYLPLGLKVLKKVEVIIRHEMDNTGALEILMPSLQPAELWHETGRYETIGDELVKFKDRHGKEMVIGPTHEEVITDIVRGLLHSYKDLPKTIYQIQTKLRDEPRPRFGVIRSKEFIMKDAYSFDRDQKGLDKSYQVMLDCYKKIFLSCGLDVIVVEADSGFMGGNESAEFMLLSESGEDMVVTCESCDYRSSLAKASCELTEKTSLKNNSKAIEEVDTPGVSTIEKVAEFLETKPNKLIKTLIYLADKKPVVVLVRGDHDVNEAKLAASLKTQDLVLADEPTILKVTGGPLGFSGPCNLKDIDIIVDYQVTLVEDAATGANKKDRHLLHVVPGRDFPIDKIFDVRYITEKEPCPKCKKPINLKRAIEIGHVFKLGTKYSDSMKAKFLDSDGKEKPFIMGCYGIGVNRIIASAIEQNNDKDGIIWPMAIAPYKVFLLALNIQDENVKKEAEKIYSQLIEDGVEVIFDDRDISPGVKFKDADLIGIPIQVVIGKKGIEKSVAEIKIRNTGERKEVPLNELFTKIQELLG